MTFIQPNPTLLQLQAATNGSGRNESSCRSRSWCPVMKMHWINSYFSTYFPYFPVALQFLRRNRTLSKCPWSARSPRSWHRRSLQLRLLKLKAAIAMMIRQKWLEEKGNVIHDNIIYFWRISSYLPGRGRELSTDRCPHSCLRRPSWNTYINITGKHQ